MKIRKWERQSATIFAPIAIGLQAGTQNSGAYNRLGLKGNRIIRRIEGGMVAGGVKDERKTRDGQSQRNYRIARNPTDAQKGERPWIAGRRTADGHWRPGVGDPNFLGRSTFAAYLLDAGLCARMAYAERRMPAPAAEMDHLGLSRSGVATITSRSTGSAFWGLHASALLFLGNKRQLDLHSALTHLGRSLAKSEHS